MEGETIFGVTAGGIVLAHRASVLYNDNAITQTHRCVRKECVIRSRHAAN